MERASAVPERLRSRIQATGAAHLHPEASMGSTTSLPGIQFRGSLPAGNMANAVVTGDFNKDGNMDFVVANGGTNDLWIYFGKGDGTFQLPRIIPLTKGQTPVYLATADLRKTGKLDLIVAEFDTATVGVLLGNGDGTFGIEKEYFLPQPPGALVVDDFNHDGKPDIVSVMVTVNEPSTLEVPYLATLLGDGTGSFGNPIITMNPGFYSSAQTIVSGDVNGDGLPDVLITGPGLENSQVYLNSGNGTFTPGATVIENGGFNELSAGQLADVNGDSCLDAIVANGDGFVDIIEGDCGGNFSYTTSVPMGDSNAAVSLVDMNGDGHVDIVTTTIPLFDGSGLGDVAGNMLAVAFGDGRGNFTPGRDYVGTGMSYSLAIADFNRDGHADVVSASPDTDTATVWLNDGSGGFGFPQGEWIGFPNLINNPISPPSFADVNGDGKPDVVVLNEGYGSEYLITTMLNDGTGRFAAPVTSDSGASVSSNWMGDYRLGDFRNIGHLDFVGIGLDENLSGGTQYILFAPGNGDGTFGKSTITPMTGADGAMVVGDFNRDGKLDLAAVGANPNGTGWLITVFLGNGDGTFHTAGTVPFGDSAASTGSIGRVFVGDFNRDSKLDILVYDTANGYWATSSYVWEFLGNGDGTFQAGQQLFSAFQPMTMADVNGDSWPDIVRYDFMWPDGTTETLGPSKFTTYLDQPSGAFAESSSYAPYDGIPLEVNGYEFGDPMASSMVADLNGDGKPDEIAFQEAALGASDVYAQVLQGNGDGTFTPTYDVFDFQKPYYVPRYAHILDGSTFSDLLEINGASSSMAVFKGGPAPALQMQLEEARISGTSGCGWVFLNVPSASSTTITLSSSVSGVNLPASVTVPAGSLSEQFCYTLDSTYDWHQVFDIRAQLGADSAIAYGSQVYTFGFSESIAQSPNAYLYAGSVFVYAGQSTPPITVSLTSAQGYSSTVQLSCQGLPPGGSCTFGSTSLSVSPNAVASTTVVIYSGPPGPMTYLGENVAIVASDSNVTTEQSFNLQVRSLIILGGGGGGSAATSPGVVTGGLIVLGIPPYTTSCSGLPAGVTCSISGSPSVNPNSDTDVSVSIDVPAGISTGSYDYTIHISSGPVSTSQQYILNIVDFSLQPPATGSAWGPPGGTVNVSVMVNPINNFRQVVTVTCSLDITATCTGSSFPVGGTSSNASLSVSLPSSATPGTHTLTATVTSGQLVHNVAFPFYIADYSGSLSTSTLSLQRGGSGSVTATVNATSGFGGAISFSCSGSSLVTCTFSPPTVQPSTTSPQTVTVTMNASLAASALPLMDSNKAFLLLGLVLPFGIAFAASNERRVNVKRAAVASLFLLLLFSLSCGGGGINAGGGGGTEGGGSGPNTYSITLNATAAGTNTTRTLGTINVTVTH